METKLGGVSIDLLLKLALEGSRYASAMLNNLQHLIGLSQEPVMSAPVPQVAAGVTASQRLGDLSEVTQPLLQQQDLN